MAKKNVPPSVRDLVLEEASFRCAHCGQHDELNLTTHHIERERGGGKTDRYNLIALCFNCHHRVDETHTITDKAIRKIKRHLLLQRLTVPGVNALRIARNNEAGQVLAPPWAVSHLVDEKLLSFVSSEASVGSSEGELDLAARYRITKRGETLVDTWLS